MRAPIAIVVPTWNGIRHLGEDALTRCLDAAQAQEGLDVEVIVVDNGSTDGTVTWLGRRHPDVGIVALDHNHGFAGGVNAGIARALDRGARAVALLNNDAVPEPDWLARLVAVLDAEPD